MQTRYGFREVNVNDIRTRVNGTCISLCSKNCMITFRRYSKLTSSSDLAGEDDDGREEFSLGTRSDTDDVVGDRISDGLSLREAQYLTNVRPPLLLKQRYRRLDLPKLISQSLLKNKHKAGKRSVESYLVLSAEPSLVVLALLNLLL